MKLFFFLIIIFLLTGCVTDKGVYWCGDHPCINKKEREAYFKKTMIVEIKKIEGKDKKKYSEIEKITQQARKNEKLRIKNEKDLAKQEKIQQKAKIKREKEIAKQAKREEKLRIKKEAKEEKMRKKEEKNLAKAIVKNKKNKLKREANIVTKELKQPKKSIGRKSNTQNIIVETNKFEDLVKNITNENSLRPFPDINDIPD